VHDINRLISFYEHEGAEELRLREDSPHYLEFLTATQYLSRYLAPKSRVLDSCAGSGAYAFYLAQQGHRVTAGDLVARNVGILREQQEKTALLERIYRGDALDLSRFAPESFDAVLCMGALYHLETPADRRRAVEESLRLLPIGGLFAATYMNRFGVVLGNVRGSLSNLTEILTFMEEGREDVFYAATPEEMAELMASCGLEILCHAALDGLSNFLHGTAGLLDDKGFRRWREVHRAVCETPSLLGVSYHNLLICRKGTTAE
jgi:2-polyprenyl-3-methyl-5-hydroxy-6-metoxy-1,4-benzoquinol methylase